MGQEMTVDHETHKPSAVVVGAGIAGCTAAQLLCRRGFKVTVLDKARGIGGRMATRKVGEFNIDHGVPEFLGKRPSFLSMVSEWDQNGWVKRSSQQSRFPNSFHGHPSAKELPKKVLAEMSSSDVDTSSKTTPTVLLESTVVKVGQHQGGTDPTSSMWEVTFEKSGTTHQVRADSVILTAPIPQVLPWLRSENGTLHPWCDANAFEKLSSADYERCFAVMFAASVPVTHIRPVKSGGEQVEEISGDDSACCATVGGNAIQTVSWRPVAGDALAGSTVKGPVSLVTLYTTHKWALEEWETDRAQVKDKVLQIASREAGLSFLSAGVSSESILSSSVQRWKFANASTLVPSAFEVLSLPSDPIAIACGDAFCGEEDGDMANAREDENRARGVERGALSGLAAASELVKRHASRL